MAGDNDWAACLVEAAVTRSQGSEEPRRRRKQARSSSMHAGRSLTSRCPRMVGASSLQVGRDSAQQGGVSKLGQNDIPSLPLRHVNASA